ncbi:MAG: STAS domain-containing protein [Deltaproteobacteria bacterium]|nr:STAS domain-containing protein [Deltaproteobacteria bacterium]
MQSQNVIQLKKQGTVIVLHVKGNVTVGSETCLKQAYSEANALDAPCLLLVFEESAYINSGGIALLIQLMAESRRRGQKVAIAGLSRHYRKIFNMLGITKFATMCDDADNALRDLATS